jgi:ubiquitin carboxyl-terminal hydrolase L5
VNKGNVKWSEVLRVCEIARDDGSQRVNYGTAVLFPRGQSPCIHGPLIPLLVSLPSHHILHCHIATGLIFLFQWTDENKRKKKSSGGGSGANSEDGTSTSASSSLINRDPLPESETPPGLFFAHQVTTNACATQAILSVVLNRLSDDKLGPVLQEFKAFTADFPPGLRGMAISGSEEIKTAHNAFARPDAFLNDEKIFKPKDEDDGEAYHFVAYLPFQGLVLELDGLQSGPIVVGACHHEDDSNNAMEGDHVDSDWLAVAQHAIQVRMDESSHESEQAKRESWKLENQRRRHNYVPLVMEVIKALAQKKMLQQLSADAQLRAAARIEAGKKRRAAKSDE